jgi:AcrR family transcriptional regulator
MNERPVWFDDQAPTRKPEPLSLERIVAAAIDLADHQADGEITMRTLADRLGVRSPMALYRYVGNKDRLADLMADHGYSHLEVTRGQGWRVALHRLGTSGWSAVQRHPWFARLAFSRPPLGPHALAAYDAALAELDPLDLPAATRMGFVNTVLGHVLGSGLALLEEQAMRTRTGLATEQELATAAAPYLDRISEAGEHPFFIRWANDPNRHAAAPQTFEVILGWLLDGLATLADHPA